MTTTFRLCSRAALLGLSCLLTANAAGAESRPFRGSFDSVAHPTAVDTNGDGQSGLFAVGEGRSTAGRATRQGWLEFLPWDGVTFCGPTHVLVGYRKSKAIERLNWGLQGNPERESNHRAAQHQCTGQWQYAPPQWLD